MKRALCLALLLSSACSRHEPTAAPFTILAGSELKDVQTRLSGDIRDATGLDLDFTYSGTLEAMDRIAAGEQFDALWVSHGKYLAMNASMKGKIVAQEKTMLSPVLLGLKPSKAKELGWDHTEPTWKEISEAAREGKFTFGMTNPASSNTGLTAMIGLAAALSKNPETMTGADLKNPRLADFFHGQSLSSGSSGWLAEAYQEDPSRVDGIINYESVLLSLKLSEPLALIYPKEGIITADYPLMLLKASKRTSYDKLVKYLRSTPFQTKISAVTLRRPVNSDATVAAAIPKRTLIELPFPGQPAQIDALLDTFVSALRIPASSRYVLDLSGSMTGERLASLKQAMQLLKFQDREEIGIITFSSQTALTKIFTKSSAPGEFSDFISQLRTGGGTAIYSSVQQALQDLDRERTEAKEKRYYTVVLMTDGESNRGLTDTQFKDWYKAQSESLRGIRVFPILFGEASPKELKDLAAMTGGNVFDSRSKSLASVFKEIRGYQ